MTWNFTLQRELRHGFFAQTGYVASRGVGIPQLMNQNISQLGGGTTGQAFFNQFGTATLNVGDADQPYALRFFPGPARPARRLDGRSAPLTRFRRTRASAAMTSRTPRLPIELPQYLNLARAVEPQDRTHVFTFSVSQHSPFGRGKRWLTGGVGSRTLGGWRITGLFAAYTGKPFNITGSTTPLNSNGVNTQRPDLVNPDVAILGGIGPGQKYFDTAAFAAVTTARIGTAGYDILRGPGARNLDASLTREFGVSERIKLQVRADGYNVTNTPHFAAPNGSITSSAFGRLPPR